LENSQKKNWWNKSGDFKILHKINPIRVNYILKNFKNPLKEKKVLDIGCGGGLVSEALSLKGAFVTAIDENNKNLNQAKNHAKINSLKINYIKSSFDNFYKKNKNKKRFDKKDSESSFKKPFKKKFSKSSDIKSDRKIFSGLYVSQRT